MYRLNLFLILFILSWPASGQVRFYMQYEALPFIEGTSVGYSVLTGVKLDPNKEIIAGIGLTGQFNPSSLQGTLNFDRSFYSLGFNYYQTRKLYYRLNITYNVIGDLTKSGAKPVEIAKDYFFDYQLDVSYILLRRIHLSVGAGVLDLANIVRENVDNLLNGRKVNVAITLSANVYLFQIKF